MNESTRQKLYKRFGILAPKIMKMLSVMDTEDENYEPNIGIYIRVDMDRLTWVIVVRKNAYSFETMNKMIISKKIVGESLFSIPGWNIFIGGSVWKFDPLHDHVRFVRGYQYSRSEKIDIFDLMDIPNTFALNYLPKLSS